VDGSGLRGLIASVHAFARVLRDRISSDGWRILQEIYSAVTDVPVDPNRPAARIPELLDNLIERFAAFVGLAGDSMTRGQAWRFLDIGRRVERVDFTARFVSGTLTPPGNDSVLLEAVLEVMDCSLTYRRRYLTHLEVHAVADLLLADESNPRGVAFQLAQLEQHLAALEPSRARQQRHDRAQRQALARSRLADDAERVAGPHGERDGVDRGEPGVPARDRDAQVPDLEQRAAHDGGLNASASPSPSSERPRPVSTTAMPGSVANSQWVVMNG